MTSDTSPALPKVLVVDDDEMVQTIVAAVFSDKATIIPAFNLADGEAEFKTHGNSLTAILMDGQVPDDAHRSTPLIRQIREAGFSGPIVANSSSASLCEEMTAAGCDYSVKGIKGDGPVILDQVLTDVAAKAAPTSAPVEEQTPDQSGPKKKPLPKSQP